MKHNKYSTLHYAVHSKIIPYSKCCRSLPSMFMTLPWQNILQVRPRANLKTLQHLSEHKTSYIECKTHSHAHTHTQTHLYTHTHLGPLNFVKRNEMLPTWQHQQQQKKHRNWNEQRQRTRKKMYTCAAVFYENKIQKTQKRQKETGKRKRK